MADGKHESKYTKENNWGEQNTCSPEFEGTKASGRDKTMCGSLTVQGQTTLAQTEVEPPEITIGGQTFVPTEITYVTSVSGPPTGAFSADGLNVSTSTITVLAVQG